MPSSSYAVLDEALERLAPYDINLVNGNANHAPMVAETLCALGRPAAVLPWIEAYPPATAVAFVTGGPHRKWRMAGDARPA
jgi:hypothetical protein